MPEGNIVTRPSVILAVLAIAVAPTPLLAQSAAPDSTELKAQAGGVLKSFAPRMLKELQDALQSGGPLNAIKACNSAAPTIAKEEMAKANGWKIGRTALRVRNPGNAPDEFERKTLEAFAAKIAAGADIATLDNAEIVGTGANRTFRYMKAIPLGEPCVTCHGSDLKPEVKAAIDELYPQDKATGFKQGELRGAFTLSRPLP